MYTSGKLPDSFNGLKVVHLSDLHSKLFGKDQSIIASKIRKIKPDLIVFTGDLIDDRHYEEKKLYETY
jgi:predicted MPP superfamily phosphohydrolase